MSMPFSLTGVHLRDGIHAGPAFLAQVLNIYLNLHRQHLAETGQKPLPTSSGGESASRHFGSRFACDEAKSIEGS